MILILGIGRNVGRLPVVRRAYVRAFDAVVEIADRDLLPPAEGSRGDRESRDLISEWGYLRVVARKIEIDREPDEIDTQSVDAHAGNGGLYACGNVGHCPHGTHVRADQR